jgi:hypothetical protein
MFTNFGHRAIEIDCLMALPEGTEFTRCCLSWGGDSYNRVNTLDSQ